jgi:DNA-binding SARP family transcriptional activator
MFFYLLCCRIGQTKEQIAAALWPDMSPSKASSNFHINLYRARRAIFPTAVILEQGQYKVNPTINIWFDVVEFEHLSSQAESLPLNDETKATNLRQASELYKGPFMGEFYSEWTEIRRRELEDKYVKALSQLANYHSSRGEYATAISYLEKSLAIDPYQDEVYCKIMEWHLASGDKASALRLYKHYLDTMTRELKLDPPPHISDLHKRIMISE